MTKIDFIIIDPIVGQYTMTLAQKDATFMNIKQLALERSWDIAKNDKNHSMLPVLSLKDSGEEYIIEEDKDLSFYNLQNGGVLFLLYMDLNIMIEN